MKIFILISLGMALLNFSIAGIITFIISRFKKNVNRKKKIRYVLIFFILGTILYFGGAFVFFGGYYRADDVAKQNMKSDIMVDVKEIDQGYFFDGPGSDRALIFYPGARVEPISYANILHELAKDGTDCFLLKMPLNMAVLDRNKAQSIISEYKYDRYYIGGHSLGGAMSSVFTITHTDEVDGLILLAAYSTTKINDDVRMLSIAGDKDEVLKWDSYNMYRSNWSNNGSELIIKGGNHAGFGDYGKQSGDGEADIDNSEQQRQTVEAIEKFLE
jgi:hypothetical protein